MALGEKKRVVMEQDRAVPGGVATLDDEGKLPLEQAPTLPVAIHAEQHRTGGNDPLTPEMIGTLTGEQIQALVGAVQAAVETAQATAGTAQSVAEAAQAAASAKATVATGTYTGNTYSATTKSLAFPFKPVLGFIFPVSVSTAAQGNSFCFFTTDTITLYSSGGTTPSFVSKAGGGLTMSWSGNTLTVGSSGSYVASYLNQSGNVYRFIVVGDA